MFPLPGNKPDQRPAAEVSIRSATPADCGRLAELHAGAFANGWKTSAIRNLLKSPNVFGLVSRSVSGSAILGFVLGRVVADEGEILTLVVAPDFRNRRIGARLIADALRVFRERYAKNIFLEVAEENDAAIGLYRRHEFVQVGSRPNYVSVAPGMRRDALIMRRSDSKIR